MAQDDSHNEDKFDFNDAGEALGYISLDQAVLQARRLARQDDSRYLQRLGWDEIVWAEINADQREDSYRVVLQFRRPSRGLREEQMGEEEFLFDLTGSLQDRQVLLWPEGVIGDISGDSGTETAAPDVSPTPVPKDVDALEVPSAPVIPDSQPGAADRTLEPLASVSESVVPIRTPAADPLESPAETLEAGSGAAAPLRCSRCRAEYQPGQVYCTRCGEAVDNAPRSAASAEQTSEPAASVEESISPIRIPPADQSESLAEKLESAPAAESSLRCSHCQAEYEPGQIYCTSCGEVLADTPRSPASSAESSAPRPMNPGRHSTTDYIPRLSRSTSHLLRPEDESSSAKLRIPENVELASAGQRAKAFAIDSCVYIAILFTVLFVPDESRETANTIFSLIWAALNIGFFVIWLYGATKGWSPGKLVLRIRIVTVAGRTPGWRTALTREVVGRLVSGVLFIGYLWMYRDPRRQGWHDKLAGTIVVRKN